MLVAIKKHGVVMCANYQRLYKFRRGGCRDVCQLRVVTWQLDELVEFPYVSKIVL